MAELKYDQVRAPNVDASRLISQGGNLLINSIGALGNTFRDRRNYQEEQDKLNRQLATDEANAYVARQVMANNTQEGIDNTFRGFLNDAMAQKADLTGLNYANTFRNDHESREVNRANVRNTNANTASTHVSTAGKLIANDLAAYRFNNIKESDRYADMYAKNLYNVNDRHELQAKINAQNEAVNVENAQNTYNNVGTVSLARTALDNYASEYSRATSDEERASIQANMADQLRAMPLSAREALVASNPMYGRLFEGLGEAYSTGQVLTATGANNSGTNSYNRDTIGNFLNRDAVAPTSVAPTTVVEDGNGNIIEAPSETFNQPSPVQGSGILSQTVEQTTPSNGETVQRGTTVPTNTENSVINEIGSIIEKANTQPLTGSDRGRLNQLINSTTPEERAVYGISEETANKISRGSVGTPMMGNFSSSLGRDGSATARDMGVRLYDVEQMVARGEISPNAPINVDTLKTVIDKTIAEQGGADALNGWFNDSVLKYAYDKYPELRNTYSPATHDKFVDTLANDLYKSINPSSNNTSSKEATPAVGGLLNKEAQNNSNTSEVPTNKNIENVRKFTEKGIKTVNAINNATNTSQIADISPELSTIENEGVLAIKSAQKAYEHQLEQITKYKASDLTTPLDVTEELVKGIEGRKDEEEVDVIKETIGRAWGELDTLGVPAIHRYDLLKQAYKPSGDFDIEMARNLANGYRSNYLLNQTAIMGITSQLESVKSLADNIPVITGGLKAMAKEGKSLRPGTLLGDANRAEVDALNSSLVKIIQALEGLGDLGTATFSTK